MGLAGSCIVAQGQADSSGKPGEARWKGFVPDLQRIAATDVEIIMELIARHGNENKMHS